MSTVTFITGMALEPWRERFAIDRPRPYSMLDGSAAIAGWVANAPPGACVEVRAGSSVLASATIDRPRADVARRLGLAEGATPGFIVRLDGLDACTPQIEVHLCEPGRSRPLARIGLESVELEIPRRVFYMHVAKTAGSSVNAFFADRLGAQNCALHVESDPRWRTSEGLATLARLPFLSGHIRLREIRQKLPHAEYALVTTLREPLSHLMSHIAWIRSLSEPEARQRLLRHPEYVQRLSALMTELPLDRPEGLETLQQRMEPEARALLDNCQTRYLAAGTCGHGVQASDLASAIKGLHAFLVVGMADELDSFLAACAGQIGAAGPVAAPTENVAARHYGISAGTPGWAEAAEPLIRFDRQLVAAAQATTAARRVTP